jgi:hypothetical protein
LHFEASIVALNFERVTLSAEREVGQEDRAESLGPHVFDAIAIHGEDDVPRPKVSRSRTIDVSAAVVDLEDDASVPRTHSVPRLGDRPGGASVERPQSGPFPRDDDLVAAEGVPSETVAEPGQVLARYVDRVSSGPWRDELETTIGIGQRRR